MTRQTGWAWLQARSKQEIEYFVQIVEAEAACNPHPQSAEWMMKRAERIGSVAGVPGLRDAAGMLWMSADALDQMAERFRDDVSDASVRWAWAGGPHAPAAPVSSGDYVAASMRLFPQLRRRERAPACARCGAKDAEIRRLQAEIERLRRGEP
jgi:hypothetical protein